MSAVLINRFIEKFSSIEIIDLDFIYSDLVEIPFTESEQAESISCDSLASLRAEEYTTKSYDDVPLGKLVL